MAKTKRVPSRCEIDTEDTWDLTPLFKSDAAWERAYRKVERQIDQYARFKGTLRTSAKAIRDCYAFDVAFEKQAERLGAYAFLKGSEDVANSTYQGMVARYTHLATRANEAASYIAPEIQAIPKKRMAMMLKSRTLKEFRIAIERLLRYRPHILSAREERLLAMQGEVVGTARRAFGQLTDADFKFGLVKDEKGHAIELTQSSFRSLLESPERSVRQRAFEKFYGVHENHANSLAALLSGSVLQDVYQARARNYASALEAALFADNVPVSVYDNLIETVRANLETVYRCLELRRRALNVKQLRFYDNYVPIVPMARKRTRFNEAVGTVCGALAPLGAEYCRVLENGLRNGRWVDRYENKGKRSGAFSAGGHTGPPYILMNYRDDVIDSVFTLAHEAGHSMHTYYSARNQPFQYYDYAIFVAEVASTFNEQLLNRYLLERARSRKMRAFLINREIDEIRGTFIRQTMFAEFEKIIHAVVENGEALTLDRIRDEYRKLLELYFGPKFALDPALSLESMRIPHFYRAFYVYKYATGMAAAIALAQRVLDGGKRERSDYLNFLKAGASKFPLELLRDAGVDMVKPEPVATTMTQLKHLVEQLEELV
ncbi:MAG TPA: oligoendopeptidase F [Candidatus Hydrogenedentes bacterium]|nr:oligoendopeptidase F [Candidatus Hydrogenedentota bacterium]